MRNYLRLYFISFFFHLFGDHLDLPVLTHSFPTRRPSHLAFGLFFRSIFSRDSASSSSATDPPTGSFVNASSRGCSRRRVARCPICNGAGRKVLRVASSGGAGGRCYSVAVRRAICWSMTAAAR